MGGASGGEELRRLHSHLITRHESLCGVNHECSFGKEGVFDNGGAGQLELEGRCLSVMMCSKAVSSGCDVREETGNEGREVKKICPSPHWPAAI